MEIREFSVRYNEITGRILEHFSLQRKNENIIFSPLSVIMLLGIMADAVKGKAREEILEAISEGLSYEDLMEVLKKMQDETVRNRSLMSSNAVCVRESFRGSISEDYPKHLKEIFGGKLFSSPDMVRDINAWVRRRTGGMIETAVDGSVDQMLACLMNAVAFDAKWMKQYMDYYIEEGEFRNADGSVSEAQMMNSIEYSYIEDESFTGFIKPYRGRRHAFMGLLPKEKEGKTALNVDVGHLDLMKLFREAKEKKVYVAMPEFRSDLAEDLTGLFQDMGIRTIFSSEADFFPMSCEWLRLDSVIHKAHIEVDRKGTKASAVSIGITVEGGVPEMDHETVILDRSFVYAVMDTKTVIPVFAGICNMAGNG